VKSQDKICDNGCQGISLFHFVPGIALFTTKQGLEIPGATTTGAQSGHQQAFQQITPAPYKEKLTNIANCFLVNK
jgi:hypothetical protein